MKTTFLAVCMAVLATQMGPQAGSSPVVYIPAVQVAAAFDKGMPMLETAGFKIHASRRDGAGMAEIHTRDTDILYVLEGTATIVTGGDAIGAISTAPDELRGSAIRGGEERRLAKGDVFVIPNGVPHLFKETSQPFLYYVVKATAPNAGGTR